MENNLSILWTKICKTLDTMLPNWRDRILQGGQVSAVEDRDRGYQFSDQKIFEGIVKAVLSNSTDWSKIERVLPELHNLFHDFDLHYYSMLDRVQISNDFIPWFQQRRAGSITMESSLINLIETAKKLFEYAQPSGSLHRFFAFLSSMTEGSPIYLVQAIGSPRSMHKLPALGIPIAAEAMKNIGYDVAKPDRHINRAMGCFKLAQFSNWRDYSDRKPPMATEKELITVMKVAARFAEAVSVRVSFLDNAIWLLCAKSGLYFSNNSLRELGRC